MRRVLCKHLCVFHFFLLNLGRPNKLLARNRLQQIMSSVDDLTRIIWIKSEPILPTVLCQTTHLALDALLESRMNQLIAASQRISKAFVDTVHPVR